MREYDPSHETDLRFGSPKLEAICSPSLTMPTLVASSSLSTLRGNTAFIMTLPNPPFPLAHSAKFEIGETFSINLSTDENNTCYVSVTAFIEVYDFDATL